MECDPPVLKRKMNFVLHPNCTLNLIMKEQQGKKYEQYWRQNWKCNFNCEQYFEENRFLDAEFYKKRIEFCKSGITDFGQTKFIQGYCCKKCNFDICVQCLLYYIENF